MSFAPFHGALKTGMALVGSLSEDIEIYLFDNLIDIIVCDDMVNIADGGDHEQALLCGVDHLGFGLVFQDTFITLDSHNQFVAQGTCIFEQVDMSYMEQVKNPYCFSIPCYNKWIPPMGVYE